MQKEPKGRKKDRKVARLVLSYGEFRIYTGERKGMVALYIPKTQPANALPKLN